MTQKAPRPARTPKPKTAASTSVFRDFVRQLEKLDVRQPRTNSESSR